MNVSVIAERIGCAVSAGILLPKPPELQVGPLTVGDLTRPYGEVFPGVEMIPAGTGAGTRDVFGWGSGHLLKPRRLQPSPRRSRGPLPAPRPCTAPRRLLNPGLFASAGGVWEWYQRKGLAKSEMLAMPLTVQSVTDFVAPLWDELSDWNPLGIFLEEFGESSVFDAAGLSLLLPHTSYEEEYAGVIEAFLSGPDTLASLLTEMIANHDLELPPGDRALIAKQGFVKLCQHYADFPGEKACDLVKLENFGTTFFGKVYQRFPEWEAEDPPVISGDCGRDGCEIVIASAETIDFGIAYAEAYFEMMNAMPDPYRFAFNEGGATETFIHELCKVWRKGHGKRAKKRTHPEAPTLAEYFKRGEA